MRLELILPSVMGTGVQAPRVCPYKGCGGKRFRAHQRVEKPLRDLRYSVVEARRYACLRCQRTFRRYPSGVSRAQTSLRVKGLAVMLYLLGLSYGAVSLALDALGAYMCKSRVYDAVQAAAERVPGLKREQVFAGLRTPALGGDLTSVKVNGEWLVLGLTVDDISGLVLTVDGLEGENAETLQEWIAPIAEAVEAEILITDDADALKRAADASGLEQQVCKGHVQRNTEALMVRLRAEAASAADGSLAAVGVTPVQALADLAELETLIQTRCPADVDRLGTLHMRYIGAACPGPGETASTAYRMRLLFLDRWNLWSRLTRYRTWRGPDGETIDGTNNSSERAIGWWVKERYRTMRAYKRRQSAVNVSRLLAWCGNHLDRGGADLSLLVG